MKNAKFLIVLVIATFSIFQAQAQFTVTGQFRTRAEYRDGYKPLPTETTNAILLVTITTQERITILQTHCQRTIRSIR